MVTAVLDNITAATIIAFFVGITVIYLTRNYAQPGPRLVKNRALKDALKGDASASTLWKIRARTGSYFVRETLPSLVENRISQVAILLMDPSRAKDLSTYEEMRDPSERENWSSERIKADICVSIIRIIQFHNRYPRVDLKLGVTSAGWVQSLDITSRHIFLCGQGKGDSALVIPSGHELFDRFVDDFGAAESLATPIHPLPRESAPKEFGLPSEPINGETILRLQEFFRSNLNIDISVSQSGIGSAVIERSKRRHHYA